MKASELAKVNKYVRPFNGETYSEKDEFTYIGDGHLGGKARRLAILKEKIATRYSDKKNHLIIPAIPRLIVITTQYFEDFMEENNLNDSNLCQLNDEQVARYFQEARLPEALVRQLEVLLSKTHAPLAARSSSLLEDSLDFPLAGIYKTKMLPNNQPDLAIRLYKLSEAVKYIYASTFFRTAQCTMRSTARNLGDEQMAVIIQEVVGQYHGERFYPNISGVARSFNFYPAGHAKAEDGIVNLALGLGKAIVEGGAVWSFSPHYPEVNPPYDSVNELLEKREMDFWAVNMRKSLGDEHIHESEYLAKLTLRDAEQDHTLGYITSSYDFGADRFNIGIRFGSPRTIDYAPTSYVNLAPLNQAIKSLVELCEETFDVKVEIEFAVTFDPALPQPLRFNLLQVRPMAVFGEPVELDENEIDPETVFIASQNVLGNGCIENVKDIVYVTPETFDLQHSLRMAREIEAINHELVREGMPYVLIGFGRWGTSIPSLGIPINWGQICGARVMVEISVTGLTAELTQGSHFFHNISNLRIPYFSLTRDDTFPIDWGWLEKQTVVYEGNYVKHVRLSSPLTVKVDGRKRKGVIFK